MAKPTYQELMDAGVHFGHMKRKWNPKMQPNIFMERKGIHIIDLNRTDVEMDRAAKALKQIAASGKKVLFVATKKQARDIVSKAALSVGMPFVVDRWLGGMMTNFSTIRKSVKKMQTIDTMLADTSLTSVTKKEKLTLTRERNKLERVLGGIANLNRLPGAIFIVDIGHEHIALAEATKLGMRTFGMVDTNSDPNIVDYAIPANDDASKSITIIIDEICKSIQEGLEERKNLKANPEAAETKTTEAKVDSVAPVKEETVETKTTTEETVVEKKEAPKVKAVKAKAPAKGPKTEKPAAKKPAVKKAAAKKPAAKKATTTKAVKEEK